MNTPQIRLRIIGFARRGKYYGICLETYNVVRADSFQEVKMKMKDALTLYLRSFTEEELSTGSYLRPAPIQYRALWVLAMVGLLSRALIRRMSSFVADYDPHSENLRLA